MGLLLFIMSQKTDQLFDDVQGIEKLLTKLEYNAFSDIGRFASDYGVPGKIIEYYDNESKRKKIMETFDSYELNIFKKVEGLIKQ